MKTIFRSLLVILAFYLAIISELSAAENTDAGATENLPELPNEIIVDILDRIDYSNSYLVSLYKQGGKLKSVAKMMMMDRMKGWGLKEPERGLESSQQILDSYAKNFLALHKVWEEGSPTIVTLKTNRSTQSLNFLGFDPFVNGRMLVREVYNDQSAKLKLWDINAGVSRYIYDLEDVPSLYNKVFFLSWDRNRVIVQVGRELLDLDFSGYNVEAKVLSSNFRAIEAFVDQEYHRFLSRGLSSSISVFDLDHKKPPVFLEHDRTVRLFQEKVNERAGGETGHYVSVSKEKIKRWDRKSLRLIGEMTLDRAVQNSPVVSVAYREKDPDLLTLITSNGWIQNIDFVENEVTATGTVPEFCQTRSHRVTVAIGEKVVGISCRLYEMYLLNRDSLTKEGVIRASDLITGKLYNLPGTSERFISWDPYQTSVDLFDAKEKSYLGKLGGYCAGSFFERICRYIGVLESEPYQIKHMDLNPWDQDKIITSNGSNLAIWNLNTKQVDVTTHPYIELKPGQTMQLNPYNPNYVMLLNSDGSIAVFDFWHAAKARLSE